MIYKLNIQIQISQIIGNLHSADLITGYVEERLWWSIQSPTKGVPAILQVLKEMFLEKANLCPILKMGVGIARGFYHPLRGESAERIEKNRS